MTKFNLYDTVCSKPDVFKNGLCYKGVIVKKGKGGTYKIIFEDGEEHVLDANKLFTSDEYAKYVLNLFKKRDGKRRKSKTKRRKRKSKIRKNKFLN